MVRAGPAGGAPRRAVRGLTSADAAGRWSCARPLPYSPFASASLDHDGTLLLGLRNRGRQAAHFVIYRYDDDIALPLHLDIERDHTEALGVSGGGYDIAVQGPNRFWYEPSGDANAAAAGIEVGTEGEGFSRRLHIELANHGDRSVTLSVRGHAYSDRIEEVTARPRQRRRLSWTTDQGWYDVEVTTPADPSFRRRLTGRLEDGRPGVTA